MGNADALSIESTGRRRWLQRRKGLRGLRTGVRRSGRLTMPDLNERRAVDSVVLALLRTEMANRRTLLAYVKTALGIAVTGFGLIRFTEPQSAYASAGMALLPVSVGVLIVGAIDFIRTRRKIQSEKLDAGV